MRSTGRLRAAAGNSRVVGTILEPMDGSLATTLDTAVSSSQVAAAPGRVLHAASSGADRSRILGWSRRAGSTWLRAPRTAVVVDVGRTVANWMRASVLYRWLTEEPDTEVIVIDVRETLTVGSIVVGFDRVLRGLAPAGENSLTGRLAAKFGDGFPREPIRAVGLAVLATVVGVLGSTAVLGTLTPFDLFVWTVIGILAVLCARVRTIRDAFATSTLARLLLATFEPTEGEADDHPDTEAEAGDQRTGE